MQQVNIGSSPIRISRIAFGGNVFGWTVDEKRSAELLDAFVDRGFNCVDTADVYARFAPGHEGGESETVIGNWLKKDGGKRGKIVLCTKVGLEMGPGRSGLSAAYIEQAVEASLRRLNTDYIDLYIAHRDDPNTPLEETLAAFDRLIRAGKVRAIGASNYSADRLKEALDTSRARQLSAYVSLQPLYNLYDRASFEGPLEQVCKAEGLSVFPYFALGSGFLTGKYRSAGDLEGSSRGRFVERYLDERGFRILAAMDDVAARSGHSLVRIALAWLLARPSVAAPVASATSLAQLDEMLGAVDVRLGEDDLAALEAASAP